MRNVQNGHRYILFAQTRFPAPHRFVATIGYEHLQLFMSLLLESSSLVVVKGAGFLLGWWFVACGVLAVLRRARERSAGSVSKQKHRPIVLHDGECNMCNGFVAFCAARGGRRFLSFNTLQSSVGRRCCDAFGVPSDPPSTFVLVENGTVYVRSDAALRTLSTLRSILPQHDDDDDKNKKQSASSLLPSPWLLMMVFHPVPKFLRDAVYDLGWKHRKRIFGERPLCQRFLPDGCVADDRLLDTAVAISKQQRSHS